jgi:hypothetical protein
MVAKRPKRPSGDIETPAAEELCNNAAIQEIQGPDDEREHKGTDQQEDELSTKTIARESLRVIAFIPEVADIDTKDNALYSWS